MPSKFIPKAFAVWPKSTAHKPGPPDTKLQVVLCGLPRTGTTSTGEAVSILLDGPIADCGNIARTGDPDQQKRLVNLMWGGHLPIKDQVDKTWIKHELAQLLRGYNATTDAPCCYFVEELVEMYPDAKFICTTRDKASWWRSYTELCKRITKTFDYAWASGTVTRYCHYCWGVAEKRIPQAMDLPNANVKDMDSYQDLWDRHAEYIKRVVPKDRLYYYCVKDGWEPLCKILDKPVPDRPFPTSNTKKVMDGRTYRETSRLKARVAFIVGSAVSSLAVLVAYHGPVLRGLASIAQTDALWMSKALATVAS